jgi:multidrug efflux pump subunit AcrB
VPAYLAVAALIVVVIGGTLGRAIFPTVDAGQFTLRMRATAGTRIEETEKLANKTLDIVRREVGPQNVALTLGFVGVQNAAGAVAICVGIDFSALSSMTRLPDHAARSIV